MWARGEISRDERKRRTAEQLERDVAKLKHQQRHDGYQLADQPKRPQSNFESS